MQITEARDPETGRFLKGNRTALKHGAFSTKSCRRIQRLVLKAKRGWYADLGPNRGDLTTSQGILIAKAAFMLERTAYIELWLEDQGYDGIKMLRRGMRDIYLAWANSLRLTLRELGIKTRVGPKVQTEREYLDGIERKRKEGKDERVQADAEAG